MPQYYIYYILELYHPILKTMLASLQLTCLKWILYRIVSAYYIDRISHMTVKNENLNTLDLLLETVLEKLKIEAKSKTLLDLKQTIPPHFLGVTTVYMQRGILMILQDISN